MQTLEELCKLEDSLNLTGQVTQVGAFPKKAGGFSDVYEGSYKGKKIAIKVIREFGSDINTLTRRLVRETRNWHKLHHRNVLQLLGFTYGFGGGKLASLVAPWMPLGTATAYLKAQPVSERFRVVTEVADGLSYLHRHDVVHGDLKGDNILIDHDGQSRIADFGLSQLVTEVNHTTFTSTVGSIRWMARELFDNGIDNPCVTCESDVWAFGMTVLELFTSRAPYHEVKNNWAVIPFIHRGEKPTFPGARCGFTEELWQLCDECWHENPELRPKMRDIAKRVWFLELSFKRTKKRPSECQYSDIAEYNSDMESPRLRKSPKLGLLGEYDQIPSPGSPFGSTMAFMASPPTSYRSSTIASSSTSSTPPSLSRTGSSVDHRRLLFSYSELDILPSRHSHRQRNIRTISEPTSPRPRIRTLSRDSGLSAAFGSGLGLGLELNSAPVFECEDRLGSGVMVSANPIRRTVSSPLRQHTLPEVFSPTEDYQHHYHQLLPDQNIHVDNQMQQGQLDFSHHHQYASPSPRYENASRNDNGLFEFHDSHACYVPTDSQTHSETYIPQYSYNHYSDFSPAVRGHISPVSTPRGGSPTSRRMVEMPSNLDDPIFPDPSLSGDIISEDWQNYDFTPYDNDYNTPVGFDGAPRLLTSPAFSDVTPLLESANLRTSRLPLGPTSPNPSMGDFGDFDDLTDDNLSLFGGIKVDERSEAETESIAPESPTLLTPRQSPLIRSTIALQDRTSPPIMSYG